MSFFKTITTIFAGGAGATYGYNTGIFAKWSGFTSKDKSNNNNNGSQLPQQQQVQPQPPVIVYEQRSNNDGGHWMLPMTGTALAVLAGYYYYIHRNGTKKVINKVEETSQQTQDLVTKSDKNNEKRFTELDARNTERAHTLETEIRSETRAGFQMVSEQLYCLTQVCIQTLSAIATGNSDANVAGEFGHNGVNNNLLEYAEHAQETADTLISEEHLMQKRSQNLQTIRAEIHERNPNHARMHTHPMHITAGGPNSTPMGPEDDVNNNNGNNNNNIFDMDANQAPYMTNISYKDSKHNEMTDNGMKNKSNNNNNNENESTMNTIYNYLKNNEYLPFGSKLESLVIINDTKNYIDNNKNLIICGACAFGALYAFVKQKNTSNSDRYYSKYDDRTVAQQ